MINEITQIIKLDNGREISLSTGKLAKQAHGSVELRMGKTHILATVVSNFDAKEGVDFFHLQLITEKNLLQMADFLEDF